MELLPGIHRVNTGASNAYVIVEDGLVSVVDTGLPGSAKKILRYLRELRFEPAAIQRILLTHQHPDHVGGATELVRASGAEVWAPRIDTPAIEGTAPRDTPHGPINLVFRVAIIPLLRAVKVNRQLADDDILPLFAGEGGLQVIPTPGHTLGQVAFYLPTRRLLFAGDALAHRGGKIVPPPQMFNRDTPQTLRTLAGLTWLPLDASLPGHGDPILHDAGALLAATAKTLPGD